MNDNKDRNLLKFLLDIDGDPEKSVIKEDFRTKIAALNIKAGEKKSSKTDKDFEEIVARFTSYGIFSNEDKQFLYVCGDRVRQIIKEWETGTHKNPFGKNSEALRSIPQRMLDVLDDENIRPKVALEMSGRLLSDAIEAGAFGGEQFRILRHYCDLDRFNGVESPYCEIFMSAVNWFAGEIKRGKEADWPEFETKATNDAGSFYRTYWKTNIPAVAEMVEREAETFSTAPPILVSRYEVAKWLPIEATSLGPYIKQWGEPTIKGAPGGRTKHQWTYAEIKPIVKKQFPNADLP